MKLKKVRQIFAFTLAFSMVTPCTAFASSAPVVEQAVVDVLEDGTQVLADGTKILPDGTIVAPETEQGTTETPSTPETETPTEPEVPDTGNQGGGTTGHRIMVAQKLQTTEIPRNQIMVVLKHQRHQTMVTKITTLTSQTTETMEKLQKIQTTVTEITTLTSQAMEMEITTLTNQTMVEQTLRS